MNPQSKSPLSLLLLAPCHAHSKPENTYIFGRRAQEAPTAGVEVQMQEPKRCKDIPTLWALEKPEVSIRNFLSDPIVCKPTRKGRKEKISNCNIKKGHTPHLQKKIH
jgi:hypothetical protein